MKRISCGVIILLIQLNAYSVAPLGKELVLMEYDNRNIVIFNTTDSSHHQKGIMRVIDKETVEVKHISVAQRISDIYIHDRIIIGLSQHNTKNSAQILVWDASANLLVSKRIKCSEMSVRCDTGSEFDVYWYDIKIGIKNINIDGENIILQLLETKPYFCYFTKRDLEECNIPQKEFDISLRIPDSKKVGDR